MLNLPAATSPRSIRRPDFPSKFPLRFPSACTLVCSVTALVLVCFQPDSFTAACTFFASYF